MQVLEFAVFPTGAAMQCRTAIAASRNALCAAVFPTFSSLGFSQNRRQPGTPLAPDVFGAQFKGSRRFDEVAFPCARKQAQTRKYEHPLERWSRACLQESC